ncbi:MAG TPA: hypothetical protein VF233_09060 [Nitrososphaeraceae archaeon]|jgi:hypothetical protein
MTQDTSSEINSKLVEYFNEGVAIENSAIDRIQPRMEQCPIPEAKQSYIMIR